MKRLLSKGPAAPQGVLQQVHGVLLYLHILKCMVDVIAPAAGITIDTPMGAAPV